MKEPISTSTKSNGNSMIKDAKSSLNFFVTAASAQGGRKYMEDRLHIEVVRSPDRTELDFIFAAVYDGHGGTQASEYVRRYLFHNIVANPDFFSDDDQLVLGAIRSGFLRTHFNMQKEAENWPPTTSGYPCTAGTTATCVFIRNGKLYTGHVGDSSIILSNFSEDDAGYNDAKLTDDHKPETKSERQRIEQAGGAVAAKSGIVRVIWKRPMRGHRGPVRRSTTTENIPFLAVARSLGDFWSLNPDNNEYVVSPEPDIDVFELKDSDNFLVITTDGVTNVVGIRAIIQVLKEAKRIETSIKNDGNVQSQLIEGIKVVNKNLPLNHAHCLLQHAFKKWGSLRADNISIICIELNSKIPNQTVVAVDDPSMDVCKQLTEHPMGLIRVSHECTQLLRTNTVRHRYFGTLEKGLNFSQGSFRSAVNLANRERVSTRKQQQIIQDCFKGPGFVYPEMPDDANNNNNDLNMNESLCEFIKDSIDNSVSIPCDSDMEEPRNPTMTAKNQLVVRTINEQSCNFQLPLIEEDANHAKNDTKLNSKVPKGRDGRPTMPTQPITSSAPRQGLKRRLTMEDANDGYERHMAGGLEQRQMGAGVKRVSLEEDEEEEGGQAHEGGNWSIAPPPAKRSRLQTVVNFFSNLFNFRWATGSSS